MTAKSGEAISWSEYFKMIYSAFTGLIREFKDAFASDRLTIEDVPNDVRESIEMRLAMDGQSSVSDGKILAIYRNRLASDQKSSSEKYRETHLDEVVA